MCNRLTWLQSFTHDTLIFVRQQAVMLIFQLLKEKPEQEQNLLRLLINKLVGVYISSNTTPNTTTG